MELANTLTFSPGEGEGFFHKVPAAPAIFLLRGEGEPYVSKTANLRRRLQRLLGPPLEGSKRLNLRDRVSEIGFTLTGSDFESQFLLYRLLRKTFPKTYAARLRLRPAPLVKLHLENEYPRASVTTRLGKFPQRGVAATGVSPVTEDTNCTDEDAHSTPSLRSVIQARLRASKTNLYYGPFPSRAAAEKFASDALDFFKMRRCVEDLHPDPAFPGCVYSEMKMCLAPCFKGCSDSEYRAEVARVQSFLDTTGESLIRELTEQREHAATQLAFEEAAAIHAKLDKLKPVVSQLPEIVRRIDRLDAIIAQPGADPGSVRLFRFQNAQMRGPLTFDVVGRDETPNPDSSGTREQHDKPQTMEARVEKAIQSFAEPEALSATGRIEHLAILKRWYYRSHRSGEIFIADDKGKLPLRRIVHGIGRVYRGEKPQEQPSFSATLPDIATS
jgi:excinuclease ABC subunit C